MNVSQHRLRYVRYLLLGVLPFLALFRAQAQEELEYLVFEVAIGDTLEYGFMNEPPYLPEIEEHNTYPLYGTADLPGPLHLGVPEWNILTYVPTVSSPAIDTVFVRYYRYENYWYYDVLKTIEIHVVPSVVHAVDDYAETTEGQPITINVLANDWSDQDTLTIADVPLVNNGSFSINADNTEITFTPEPGFSGLAHFNYTICDDLGTCDMAVVTIAVMEDQMAQSQTVELTSRVNTPREILTAIDGFNLVTGPNHGMILDTAGMDHPVYIPEEDYDGPDQFVYEKVENNTTYTITFQVDVLDLPEDNVFVYDDYVSTIQDEAVFVNGLANDLGGNYLMSIAVVTQPDNGQATHHGDGIFEYVPDAGFTGVDKFRYRAMSPGGGSIEFGWVYVTVSNYMPAAGTFDVSTPKTIPLVMGYQVPVENFDLEIVVEPDFGTASYYPGFQTLTIAGQTVSGYNLLVYEPDSTNVPNIPDEFEINYCVGTGPCPTASIKFNVTILDIDVPAEHVCVGDNCVWAGDANNDGKVDIRDLLPLGVAMGEVGTSRTNPNFDEWYGQYSIDWNDIFNPSPVDLKYIDTDGDGIVGSLDTTAISDFYGNAHSYYPEPQEAISPTPLYFYETGQTPVAGGDLVELDIWLGDPNDVIADDIYGITFELEYDEEFVIPGSVQIDFLNESWLSYNSPVLSLVKKPFAGRIDAGITRTSGTSEYGYGIVAEMEFIVVEDLEGIRQKDEFIDVTMTNVHAMNSAGEYLKLPDQELRIPINTGMDGQENLSTLKVFPNPAQNFFNLYLNGGNNKSIEKVELYNLAGALVYSTSGVGERGMSLSIPNQLSGMYIVRVVTNDGQVLADRLSITR
jgi:hypothetical protein